MGGGTLNKKGFTLIELLAVVVILAIIALIATPIVMNIINNVKIENEDLNLKNYFNAVEYAIVKNSFDEKNNNLNRCEICSNGNIKCEDNKELKVELTNNMYTSGTLMIENGKIVSFRNIKINNKYVSKGKNENIRHETVKPLCKAVEQTITGKIPTGSYLQGEEYICEVSPGIEHRFFILKDSPEEETKVNLIMYANIDEYGNPINIVQEEPKHYKWLSKDDHLKYEGTEEEWNLFDSVSGNNSKGPITIMDNLEKATESWVNIEKQEIETFNLIADGNMTLTKEIQKKYRTHARLPYYNEVSSYDKEEETNLYLYDYLNKTDFNKPNEIAGEYGYWIHDGARYSNYGSYLVYFNGNITVYVVDRNGIGMRPVITVSKQDLK